MKLAKSVLMRMLPVILVVLILIGLYFALYSKMIADETDACWDRMEVVTRTMSEKIANRFTDNLNFLSLVADAVEIKDNLELEQGVLNYLKNVRQNTIFMRMDVILPDGSYWSDGGKWNAEGVVDYEELLERGRHISPRVTSDGQKRFYCLVPIVSNGQAKGVLSGVIDCQNLREYFPTYSYDGSGWYFLVNREDGNILMDNRNDASFGNLSMLSTREIVEAYREVDFDNEILHGQSGKVAYYSANGGSISYMRYAPIDLGISGGEWSFCFVLQEEKIFEDLHELRNALTVTGVIIGILMFLYLIWNVLIVWNSVQNQERARKAEMESAANEARSRFLASVSHDVRTPLNGIVGMLEVIERHGDDPATMQDCLRKINISTHYLLTLAEDILDMNDLDSDKMTFTEAPLDLRELAEEVGVLVQPRARAAGVSYHMNIERLQEPKVLGSAAYIHRVLVNLIGNAIKYNTAGGGVWVTIETVRHFGESAEYRFTVRDNGIGMTEEFQKTMFVAFEQEDASARTKHTGHGLGLSIVDRLVKKMNGSIHVESRKDVGSTFTVLLTLPLQSERNADGEAGEAVTLEGTKLLLVEDNELNMEIARVLLSDAGATLISAENGRVAFETFEASKPYDIDVILMDVMMPEMDGYEATYAIRASNRPDAGVVPIIAMTAGTFVEDIKKCKDAGMNEHVGKPLDMNLLIRKIVTLRDAYRKDRGRE